MESCMCFERISNPTLHFYPPTTLSDVPPSVPDWSIGPWVGLYFYFNNDHKDTYQLVDGREIVQSRELESWKGDVIFDLTTLIRYDMLSQDLLTLGVDPLHLDDIVNHIYSYYHSTIFPDLCRDPRDNNSKFYDLTILVEVSKEHVYCERCYIQRVLRESEVSNGDNMVPASSSSLTKLLEEVKVDNKKGSKREEMSDKCDGVEDVSCAICLDEFGVQQYALRMPCSHVFHGNCIIKWLKESHYCPLCRFQMPTEDDEMST